MIDGRTKNEKYHPLLCKISCQSTLLRLSETLYFLTNINDESQHTKLVENFNPIP
tara:strand:+ start:240 stop:404 length:165 start_codon:yes stop_codon:yes gene_type:complete